MLGATLERAASLIVDGATLVVTFGAADAGVRRTLMGDDNVRSIEQIASQALGRALTLRVADAQPVVAASGGAPDESEPSKQSLTERARKDPAINRVLSEFGAQIVDIRPHRGEGEPAPPSEENA
jgi:hypothetical protein